MKRLIKFFFVLVLMTSVIGCASTTNEVGKDFSYKKSTNIRIGESSKKDVVNDYGEPTSSKVAGKYQILKYYYGRESLKHGRAIGMGALSAVTFGVSDLVVDHGVRNSDRQVESKEMVVYVDIMSGIVKDFYYHDSDLNGHDESESLLLKALDARNKGGKNQEVKTLLEKAISLNPKNHRALNSLAWLLIDDNEDVDRGILLAKEAVELFPDSPFNNGTLGVGYMKKNDLDNAEKYLDAAVKLYPVYAPEAVKAFNHDNAMLMNIKELKKQKTS